MTSVPEPLVVWINGACGVGKAAVAEGRALTASQRTLDATGAPPTELAVRIECLARGA